MKPDSTTPTTLSPERQELIRRLRAQKQSSLEVPVVSRDVETFPALLAQQSMWYLEQLVPNNASNYIPVAFRIAGSINVEVLNRAFENLVSRHEALRTTFVEIDGKLFQKIHKQMDFRLSVRSVDASVSEVDLQKIASDYSNEPLDLIAGPLFKATLIGPVENDFLLIIVVHHMVCDGASMSIIYRELAETYSHILSGVEEKTESLGIQMADYGSWQASRSDGFDVQWKRQLEFWKKQLLGCSPTLELYSESRRPPFQTFKGGKCKFALSDDTVKGLREIGGANDSTFFMVLLAAFNLLLYRYTGQDDLLVGTPQQKRDFGGGQDAIGTYINMLVLRAQIESDMEFGELLRSSKDALLNAYDNSDVPYEVLVKSLYPNRDFSRSPLVQAIIQYSIVSVPAMNGESWSPFWFDSRTCQFDLALQFYEENNAVRGHFEYSSDVFSEASILRMVEHYKRILELVVDSPDIAVSSVDILSSREKQQLLSDWNDTTRDYNLDQLIHNGFEKIAAHTPDKIALEFKGEKLTYGELNRRANQLARYLVSKGVGQDTLVGVALERSFEMVIAIYAALKAGGAYVPVDPDNPADRIKFTLNDTSAPVLLTSSDLISRMPSVDVTVLVVDTDWNKEVGRFADTNFDCGAGPGNIAYTIYTSGSTGNPKGVMNAHSGIVNRVLWMQEQYQLTEDDCVLQKTPYTFDVSVWEFFWPLMVGARLAIAEPGAHKDNDALVNAIVGHSVTTLHFVPSMLQLFLEASNLDRASRVLRQVFCSGEALPLALTDRFFEKIQRVSLHNLYGPTEAAVDVSYWECKPCSDKSTVPIGRPVANTQLYVLDRHMRPTPIGVPGELFIGGVQVALGYLNRPDLTAERFISDPYSSQPGMRLYRTGDRAVVMSDGNIDFLGRLDFQVKIRGQRIELEEIEAVVNGYGAVRESIVVASEDQNCNQYLVAYITVLKEAEYDEGGLRNHIKLKLPEYMVPSLFVKMDEFPLSANGKVDRKQLPEPDWGRSADDVVVAPRSPLEQSLLDIWLDLLPVDNISTTDDFFNIGGHSLLAVRLFGRIRSELNLSLPLSTLIRSPTIVGLANVISNTTEHAVGPVEWEVVTRINSVSSPKATICLVHSAGGNILNYKALSSLIDADVQVLGIQAKGLDGSSDMASSIEEMAASYIDALSDFGIDEPLVFSGHCMGGTVALEMSRLWQIRGNTAHVILLDSVNPGALQRWKPLIDDMYVTMQIVGYHLRVIGNMGGAEKAAYLKKRSSYVTQRLKLWVSLLFSSAKDNSQRIHVKSENSDIDLVWERNEELNSAYRPRPYSGKVTLVKQFNRYGITPGLGWEAVLERGFETIKIKPSSSTMLEEPYVKELATVINRLIANEVAEDSKVNSAC